MYGKKIHAAGLALLVSSLLTGCGDGEAKQAVLRPAMSVSMVSPQQTVWPIDVEASGPIQPWQYAQVASELSGIKLTDVLVEVGQQVQAGQLLARFDQREIKTDVAKAQATLAENQASYQLAHQQAERSRRLQPQKLVSDEKLLSDEASEKTNLAKLDSARAALEYQQLRLARTEVLAPDAGVISQRNAELGDVPSLGEALFQLIRQNRLEWRAEVTAAQLVNIHPGQAVTISANGQIAQGTVRSIAPALDASSLTSTVYVDLPANTPFKAGMYAGGKLYTGERDAISVPESALVFRDGYQYVQVLNDEQQVQLVKVTTGRRMNEQVEVLSGLAAHQAVVSAGGAFLNQGDLVKVVSQPTIDAALMGGSQ